MTQTKRDLLYLLFIVSIAVFAWPLDWLPYATVILAALGLYLLPSGDIKEEEEEKEGDQDGQRTDDGRP